eukprot:m51a1_g13489 hypothetical protein (122) ;mRNA; r:110-610
MWARCALLLVVVACACAQPFTGWATFFDAVGSTGGCGVTEAAVEKTDTFNYVALNVQDSPGDYTTFSERPLKNTKVLGQWNNGRNCGRYVRITIGDYCQGVANAGEPNKGPVLPGVEHGLG